MDSATAQNLDHNGLPSEPLRQDDGPWRPIHYLGSKLRALPAIEEALQGVSDEASPVCDLFAGSGTVASWLSRSRPVTAVDIQEYSRIICDAMLNPSQVSLKVLEVKIAAAISSSRLTGVLRAARPLIELEEQLLEQSRLGDPSGLADLIEAGSFMTFRGRHENLLIAEAHSASKRLLSENDGLADVSTMVFRHFGGVYFSFEQAAKLDVLLDVVHSLVLEERRSPLAAILTTASDIVNTVGKQFAQPIRPRDKDGRVKRTLYSQVARDRFKDPVAVFFHSMEKYLGLPSHDFNHSAVRSDYLDFLRSGVFNRGVVYADPPYTRDHYSRFYHALETIALRDDPRISTNTAHGVTQPSRGVYRVERHQSPFCIRSKAPDAFEQMFAEIASAGLPLVLSYSPYSSEKDAHPRVMTVDAISDLAKGSFASVEVTSIGGFSHSRLNKAELHKEASSEAEFLFICRP
ncbi:DNA adenine methylase [Salipiger thiooxidans]|uniref:DNA adenine methylase n=1 Tax=Salipiger thiooxidans TaxID=282683 RepID=UPI001A8EE775|nr:DNA adenine methylase [Salipiger thiooxidans]MBN8185984.1 DNA adenine methylase [Salipiger thiooxidans]